MNQGAPTRLPEHVGLAVEIEVAGADDAPGQTHQMTAAVAIGGDSGAADARSAVHEPDLRFAGRLVVPEHVRVAVAVESLPALPPPD